MRVGLRGRLAAGVVFSLASLSIVHAAGGGGMGYSDSPSASAALYDPAEEYAKGVTALQGKDYKAAKAAFGRVTRGAAKNADGWRGLGAANAGLGDFKSARKAYEKAVKIDPDNLAGHLGVGLALAALKDPAAQGELDWLKAKAQACADACADAQALKDAAAQLDAAIAGPKTALTPAPMLFAGPAAGDRAYVSAVSLINQRRYDDALAALARAREAFGPHPDILTYEGYAWRKKGDYAMAEQYYRQALAIAPDHRGATEYYGELKVERGDLAGAKAMLAKLDRICAFGCAEAEELRRWIAAGREPQG